jgi:hypothetical protein
MIDTDDWHEAVATVLAALPHGTWTTAVDLADLTSHSIRDVVAFLQIAQPDGHERVFSANGALRRSSVFAGISTADRVRRLKQAGVRIDRRLYGDAAQRLSAAALAALLADPHTGATPEGAYRHWPESGASFNTDPSDRERLTALAASCRWESVTDRLDLLELARLPRAIGYLPAQLVAAVGLTDSDPSWPSEVLAHAGLIQPGTDAHAAAVLMVGLRSLDPDRMTEVFCLAGISGALPVLVQTQSVLPAPQDEGTAPTPCWRGRHDECRGRSGPGPDRLCRCGCGCTRAGRATLMRFLEVGDDFEATGIARSTVLSAPVPEEQGRVRIATRLQRNGAECEIGYGGDWIAVVHNPRRRVRRSR